MSTGIATLQSRLRELREHLSWRNDSTSFGTSFGVTEPDDAAALGAEMVENLERVIKDVEEHGDQAQIDAVLGEVDRWLAMQPAMPPRVGATAPLDQDAVTETMFDVPEDVARDLIERFNKGEHLD
jgi:hypothetical protein